MGPNHISHFFSKPRFFGTFWVPIGFYFSSILALLTPLGPPKVCFFSFWGALARTFAHTASTTAILSEFGCPKGVPEVSRRWGRGHVWRHGKTSLGTSGPCYRVGFSTFCEFRGVYRLHATDLSQLPFLRFGFSNSFTGSVQEVVQWMCRRVTLNSSDPTRRRSCEGDLNSAADLKVFAHATDPEKSENVGQTNDKNNITYNLGHP